MGELTAIKVTKVTTPGRYGDGGGLCLQVSVTGTKSWLFRYQRNGRERWMGLGSVNTLTLKDARERAQDARKLLLTGVDPIEVRKADRTRLAAEAARGVSFRQAAEDFIDAQRPGWKNAKHAAQWKATLETYAYPIIGKLPIAAVDTSLVLKVLRPIWNTRTETAKRLRGRIEAIWDAAKVAHKLAGDNPARWRGHLKTQLANPSDIAPVRHQPALPFSDMPRFIPALRAREGIGARALEFTILTAARPGDTLGATRREIDIERKTWIVQGHRLKGRKGKMRPDHRIPLCPRAIEILKALPGGNDDDLVFPAPGTQTKPLSDATLNAVLRRLGYPKGTVTTHGFRSTFRDWGSERTTYPNELLEMALAHVVDDKTERAYRRGDMLERRIRLMADWAAFCNGSADSAEVIPIRQAS